MVIIQTNIRKTRESWSPWENTMLYLKFNNNLNDDSWNGRTVTNSWTVTYNQTPSAVNLTTSSYLYSNNFDDLTHDRTVNVWVNLNAWSAWNTEHICSVGWTQSANKVLFLWVSTWVHPSSTTWWPVGWLQFAFFGTDYYTTWSVVTLNQRYNIVFTYNYTNKLAKAYVNWTNVLNQTFGTQYSLTTHNLCIWWRSEAMGDTWHRVQWSLSEYIIESKERTDEEINDYYNQTKSLYGIS